MTTGTILLLLALGAGAGCILIYNRLVDYRNRFVNAFSQIDVQLQRRHELIPNLVTVAGQYMKHEHDTLVDVTDARNTAEARRKTAATDPADASLISALSRAESALTSQVGKLSLVMESYPDLKADQNLQDLNDEIASTENRVAYARQAFSDAVMHYNTRREQFPAVIVARALAFKPAAPFEAATAEMQEAVRVSFA